MASPRVVSLSNLFAVVGMVVLGAAAPARAETSRVGVVTTLDGTATLSRVALPQGVPLKLRDDVFLSDRITTGNKSFARILLGGKAIVTVREHSVLTISEGPGTSVVDVKIGRVAVAVVKERMKPGESVEIRTPNALAGIRGTVVIAEVDQTTSQVGATSAGFTTTITVLRGIIDFRRLDGLTRQPLGPAIAVGALESVRVTGAAPPRPVQRIPADVQQRLIQDFRVPLRDAAAASPSLTEEQLRQAAVEVENLVNAASGVRKTGEVGSSADASGSASSPGSGTATGGVSTGSVSGAVSTGSLSTGSVSTPSLNTGTLSTGTLSTSTLSTGTLNTGTVTTTPTTTTLSGTTSTLTAPLKAATTPVTNTVTTTGTLLQKTVNPLLK